MADLNRFLGSSGKNVKLHEQRTRVKEAAADELHDVLQDLDLELLNLRTQAMMHQVPNPMRIRAVRKLTARIHTELQTRASAAQS